MIDPYGLQRFVAAQLGCYPQVEQELATGLKRSHWMWFIFPQLAGLGHSMTSVKYAISGLPEARDYLNHDLLGPRLQHCTQLTCQHRQRTAFEIFGSPDDMKFQSSMTLFSVADVEAEIFTEALRLFFNGAQCQRTLSLLKE